MPSQSHDLNQITPFEGKSPQFDETVFIDPSARLIGDVRLGSETSVYPLALLRADSNPIIIGDHSVILDKVLIESPKDRPVIIEREALISHGVILHGCIVREGAVVGIGAIVLDGAEVGKNSVIGSGSVVPPGMKVPEESLVLGIPGKVVKKLDEEAMRRSREQWSEAYEKSKKYLKIFGKTKW
jgi:carbonic anhydrase/acetyltransferase-like protein (isoleucine patch superfamily)